MIFADAQSVSAIGQVASAVSALVLVYVTWLYLKSTKELVALQQHVVDAAREQASAARDQAEAQTRPLLVPCAPPSGQSPFVRSQAVARLRLGLDNNGLGVAVVSDIRVAVAKGRVRCVMTRQTIAPRATAEVVAEVPRADAGYTALADAEAGGRLLVSIGYLDVLSRPADTVEVPLTYDAAEERWRLA